MRMTHAGDAFSAISSYMILSAPGAITGGEIKAAALSMFVALVSRVALNYIDFAFKKITEKRKSKKNVQQD